MIDFHSHILPNIDDGSNSMNETIKLIKEAIQAGFTEIVLTPHYIQGYYDYNCFERNQLLENVKKEIQLKNNIDIKLYLGNEIFVTPEIVELIKDEKVSTINNTKYILFELPMNAKPLFVKEVVYVLIENGYRPIIAHPERYSYVKDDISYAEELKNMGVLFQANYGSIIGLYGSGAKKTIKQLLKKDLITFLGSDVHRVDQIYPHIPKILKKLRKLISPEQLELLTTLNAQKVLNNEDL